MSNKRYVYTGNKNITSIVTQIEDGFIWVAFDKNIDNVCIIEKQFGTSPLQTFFSLEKDVDKVVKMDIDSSNLYVAYDDDTLLGEIISLTNPLTSTTEISIPTGTVEFPVDVRVDGTELYFLLPGSASGENAKILHFDTDGVYIETIDLTNTLDTVYDASSMTIDSNNEIWIVTNTSPATVVRVFEVTGGWDFQVTQIV